MRRLGLLFLAIGCWTTACATSEEPSGSSDDALTTCSAEQHFSAFTQMIKASIKPGSAGGVHFGGGASWKGLTIDEAETTLCGGSSLGEDDSTVSAGWGVAPNYQLTVTYRKSDRKIDFYQINPGYEGKLEFASRPTALGDASKPNPFGQHTYAIAPGRPVLRDGAPMKLNWRLSCAGGAADCWERQATELFDALMFTYAPELKSTQTNCVKEATCLARPVGGGAAVFGVRPLAIYMSVPQIEAPEPAPSTPEYLYGFTFKNMPFSEARVQLKLDAEGPVAQSADLGDRHTHCSMKVGMTFQSFLSDCVQVMSDAEQNKTLKAKVLGNASRSLTTGPTGMPTGTWLLDVDGIVPSFNSERFDETEPVGTARATALAFKGISRVVASNDWSSDGAVLTLAGTGAVYREYARLVQEFITAQPELAGLDRFPIGAPECLLPRGADPTTWKPALGCTGMEQFVSPGAVAASEPAGAKRMSIGAPGATRMGFRPSLTLATVSALFCSDPAPNANGKDWGADGRLATCDLSTECRSNACVSDSAGVKRCEDPLLSFYGNCFRPDDFAPSLWVGTQSQLGSVLGPFLPKAASDPNVYIRLWMKALVTYLRAPADVDPAQLPSFAPADGDIALEALPKGRVKVSYLNRLELKVAVEEGMIEEVTFR